MVRAARRGARVRRPAGARRARGGRDRDFLARRGWPLIRGAARFILDFLVEAPAGTACPGKLVPNPSHSPEQGELNAGPAMDMQLIRALIDYTTEASQILGNIDYDLFETYFRTNTLGAVKVLKVCLVRPTLLVVPP